MVGQALELRGPTAVTQYANSVPLSWVSAVRAPDPVWGFAFPKTLRPYVRIDRFKLSQAVLASVLNTSLCTVRQWEIGDKHPSGPSQKLLSLLDRKGLEALI